MMRFSREAALQRIMTSAHCSKQVANTFLHRAEPVYQSHIDWAVHSIKEAFGK